MTSVAFSRGVCTTSFSFAFEENLDVVSGEEETSLKATALTAFAFAFSFAGALERALEVTAKASDRFACVTAPDSFGIAVVVKYMFSADPALLN